MKIYTDIFSGEEILSDGYPITLEYDDVVGKVKTELIVKGDADVDIGCGNAFGGAGEEDQAGGAPVEKVINVVDNFKLEDAGLDFATFSTYFKPYMKKLLDKLKETKPDRVDAFKAGAQKFFAWVKEHKEDVSFYVKEYDFENQIVVSLYGEGATAPHLYYLMDGLKAEKV